MARDAIRRGPSDAAPRIRRGGVRGVAVTVSNVRSGSGD